MIGPNVAGKTILMADFRIDPPDARQHADGRHRLRRHAVPPPRRARHRACAGEPPLFPRMTVEDSLRIGRVHPPGNRLRWGAERQIIDVPLFLGCPFAEVLVHTRDRETRSCYCLCPCLSTHSGFIRHRPDLGDRRIPPVALPRSYERPWRTHTPVGVSALLIGSGSIRCRAVISGMFN